MTQFLPVIDRNLDGKNHLLRINILESLFEFFPERDTKAPKAVFKGEGRANRIADFINDDGLMLPFAGINANDYFIGYEVPFRLTNKSLFHNMLLWLRLVIFNI